jgi:hypothetical protein
MSSSFYAMALVASLTLGACATPKLDKRLAEVRQQVADQRAALAVLAGPYKGKSGKDVQLDVSGQPLLETISVFNGLPWGDRLMTLQSVDRGGVITEWSKSCGWLGGRYGYYVELAFDEAFAGVIYIDTIDAAWSEADGLAFRLKRSGVVAGMIVKGGLKLCFLGDVDIVPGLAVVGGGADSASGATSLTPVPNEGLRYRVFLTQPLYLIAYIAIPGYAFAVPFPVKFELTKGIIPNMLGREGSVQITSQGQIRRFVMDINLDQAQFLPAGLSASGPVQITWQP